MTGKEPGERVLEWFFRLTRTLAPYPDDIQWFSDIIKRYNLNIYQVGNNFIGYVDGDGMTETAFLAHTDTAGLGAGPVSILIESDRFASTDGKTILGADNRAGIAILLTMMDCNVPGTYMFFSGEEVGREGSRQAAKEGWLTGYSRAIQFDRRGTTSIITHQMGERGCSDEFTKALAAAFLKANPDLNFKADDGGSFTDSYSFFALVPECTNISVGFMNEHSNAERQDLRHLYRLGEAVVEMDWNALPTVQDPENRDFSWSYGSNKWSHSKFEDTYYFDPYQGQDIPASFRFKRKEYEFRSPSDAVDVLLTDGVPKYADLYNFVYHCPEEAASVMEYLLDMFAPFADGGEY